MDFSITISLIVLGIVLGAGADWLFWRRKFQQAGALANARGETMQRDFAQQLAGKEGQLGERDEQLQTAQARIGSLEEKLREARLESTELGERLQEEGRKLAAADAVCARLSALEENLSAREAELARLAAENTALLTRRAELEEALAEERKSIEDCLIFVEGSHYLPGKVVRNLTRRENRP